MLELEEVVVNERARREVGAMVRWGFKAAPRNAGRLIAWRNLMRLRIVELRIRCDAGQQIGGLEAPSGLVEPWKAGWKDAGNFSVRFLQGHVRAQPFFHGRFRIKSNILHDEDELTDQKEFQGNDCGGTLIDNKVRNDDDAPWPPVKIDEEV